MALGLVVDRVRIAHVCRSRGIRRLRVFGSATGEQFDKSRSDVDLLVEFDPDVVNLFDVYFGLKEDLEGVSGGPVDLVMADAVRNPYFHAGALATSEELYAAGVAHVPES